MNASDKPWFTYILECSNGCLYTGITNRLEKRIQDHNLGKGAKYVRAHLPAKLLAYNIAGNKSSATRQEYRIKQLSRKDKLSLIAAWNASGPCAPVATC